MTEPKTPLAAYKAVIDTLVTDTRLSGPPSYVAEAGIYSNAPDHEEFNRFIRDLSPKQRKLLVRMLKDLREGTIHDVLAELTWWIETRGVGLTFHGEPMPVDLSGLGLHGDYIGRCQGLKWPKKA